MYYTPPYSASLSNIQTAVVGHGLNHSCPAQRPNLHFLRFLQGNETDNIKQTRYATVHQASKNPSFFICARGGNWSPVWNEELSSQDRLESTVWHNVVTRPPVIYGTYFRRGTRSVRLHKATPWKWVLYIKRTQCKYLKAADATLGYNMIASYSA